VFVVGPVNRPDHAVQNKGQILFFILFQYFGMESVHYVRKALLSAEWKLLEPKDKIALHMNL